jgi:hypothetical protein
VLEQPARWFQGFDPQGVSLDMNRHFQTRLERLEDAHMLPTTPHRVLSSCPLPDEPASQAVILEWLDEGLAHVAFGRRAIFYDGGQREVLSESEWQAKYVLPQKLG